MDSHRRAAQGMRMNKKDIKQLSEKAGLSPGQERAASFRKGAVSGQKALLSAYESSCSQMGSDPDRNDPRRQHIVPFSPVHTNEFIFIGSSISHEKPSVNEIAHIKTSDSQMVNPAGEETSGRVS